MMIELRNQDGTWWLVCDGQAWEVSHFTHSEFGTLVTLARGESFRFGTGQIQVSQQEEIPW